MPNWHPFNSNRFKESPKKPLVAFENCAENVHSNRFRVVETEKPDDSAAPKPKRSERGQVDQCHPEGAEAPHSTRSLGNCLEIIGTEHFQEQIPLFREKK
jgi:hypothetical protein